MQIESYKIINEISIDLKNSNISKKIDVMQYDSKMRYILLHIFNGNEPYIIPDNFDVNIRLSKPDGNNVYNPLQFEGNKIYVELTEQMCVVCGVHNYTIEISSASERISTFPLCFTVIENIIKNEQIESVPEYKSIQYYAEQSKQSALDSEQWSKKSEEYANSIKQIAPDIENIKIQIGNLDELETTKKESLVKAINEVWNKGGGGTGSDGATFTPSVSPDGIISWTNDKGKPNPDPVNIKGPAGNHGEQGPIGPQGLPGKDGAPGPAGADGKTPVKGVDYWTNADQKSIVNDVLKALPIWSGGAY